LPHACPFGSVQADRWDLEISCMYGWVVVSSFSCKNVEPHFSLKLISVYVSVARALSTVGQRPTWPALFFLIPSVRTRKQFYLPSLVQVYCLELH
jgi:hypothetical protein